MKAGVGCSYDKDAVKAASGAAAAAVGQSGEPVLTILFTTDSYDQESVLAEVRRVTGGGHLVGFCCGGVIHGEHICTQGVGVCTLAGDDLQAAVVLQEDISRDPLEAGRSAGRGLLAGAGASDGQVFLFPDGFCANISETLQGVYEVMGAGFGYIGGGAGDNLRFFRTYQFADDRLGSDSMAAALIRGLSAGSAVGHGWRPTGEPFIIGHTEGKRVLEINGRPAFDAYRERLGDISPEEFARVGMKNPLGFPDIRGNYTIRDPLSVGRDGSINFVTEIPADAVGYLMEGRTDALIAAAGRIAVSAAAEVHKPQVVILFDCISRYLLMGDQFGREIATIRAAVGTDVPLLGALTFGEVGSYSGSPLFQNKTVSVLVAGSGKGGDERR